MDNAVYNEYNVQELENSFRFVSFVVFLQLFIADFVSFRSSSTGTASCPGSSLGRRSRESPSWCTTRSI